MNEYYWQQVINTWGTILTKTLEPKKFILNIRWLRHYCPKIVSNNFKVIANSHSVKDENTTAVSVYFSWRSVKSVLHVSHWFKRYLVLTNHN